MRRTQRRVLVDALRCEPAAPHGGLCVERRERDFVHVRHVAFDPVCSSEIHERGPLQAIRTLEKREIVQNAEDESAKE